MTDQVDAAKNLGTASEDLKTGQGQKPETFEVIAERIARHHLDSERVSVIQFSDIVVAITNALRNERERCAKIADAIEDKWIEDARNVARADDLVGGLAQSTYNNYAEVANGIAKSIRK